MTPVILKSHFAFTVFLLIVLSSFQVYAKVEPHEDHFYQHEHFTADHEHNPSYDHDAFLGPEASKFDEFPPEESKRKLRVIITTKIDLDKNGLVSFEELEGWIEKQRKNFMYEAVDENIEKQDKDGDGLITWEEYRNAYFGEWDNTNLPQDHVSKSPKEHKVTTKRSKQTSPRKMFSYFQSAIACNFVLGPMSSVLV